MFKLKIQILVQLFKYLVAFFKLNFTIFAIKNCNCANQFVKKLKNKFTNINQ